MPQNNIRIYVKTQFIERYSEATAHRFVYAYTITISNQGQRASQLISRYWRIKDARDKIQEVEGLGVVGEQPRILAGNDFTYTSNAILETETGTMEGYYFMQYDDGETFKAPIPTFVLAPAHAIH
jgi:ApaG protein